MRARLLGFVVIMLGLFGLAKAWMDIEIKKVGWAISLVGGMEALANNNHRALTANEKLFIKTLRVSVDRGMSDSIRALRLCTEISEDCSTRMFAVINASAVSQRDLSYVNNFLLDYKSVTPVSVSKCEAKYELSRLILASRTAVALKGGAAKIRAKEVIESIKEMGGIDYSLQTEVCKNYFKAHPEIARGYLAYVAFLMSVEKGHISPGWVYLLTVPGVKNILDGDIEK